MATSIKGAAHAFERASCSRTVLEAQSGKLTEQVRLESALYLAEDARAPNPRVRGRSCRSIPGRSPSRHTFDALWIPPGRKGAGLT